VPRIKLKHELEVNKLLTPSRTKRYLQMHIPNRKEGDHTQI